MSTSTALLSEKAATGIEVMDRLIDLGVTSANRAAARSGFLDPGMQLITKPFTFDLLTAKVQEMIRD
ncbi:hypothetical protein K5F93_16385 [Pseudomonas protegens]|uniref:hypothetical protein n=1 Tax=Pseudomonas protegens TaxID=380021 RepID=UPI001C8E3519|nr:hypothetical protein [Pseudomonas protegens]QZI73829.1 hypothetical protein K5F93_16385 [Pseudomonas protegens]